MEEKIRETKQEFNALSAQQQTKKFVCQICEKIFRIYKSRVSLDIPLCERNECKRCKRFFCDDCKKFLLKCTDCGRYEGCKICFDEYECDGVFCQTCCDFVCSDCGSDIFNTYKKWLCRHCSKNYKEMFEKVLKEVDEKIKVSEEEIKKEHEDKKRKLNETI